MPGQNQGKLPLNLSSVEMDTLLLEVFNEMRVLAGSKVALKLLEIDQAQVSGDRDRLKQVLINLISNAIHYTPAGGEVIMSLSKTSEIVQIIVRDTGPGIPAKDLPHIFDRFYRGEKSRTRSKSSGFGLGSVHRLLDCGYAPGKYRRRIHMWELERHLRSNCLCWKK